jgi:hypothetical protein
VVPAVEQAIRNTSQGRFVVFCSSTYEHDSLCGRATWLVGLPANCRSGESAELSV